ARMVHCRRETRVPAPAACRAGSAAGDRREAKMRSADVVVRNGTIVNAWGAVRADIAIRDEKIVAIGDASDIPSGDSEIDARGRPVLPGLVDPHVHMGGEFPFEKNCETEPRSAAAGGITTMLQYRLSANASFLQTFPHFRDYAARTFIVDTA